jgi:hypothetical protein
MSNADWGPTRDPKQNAQIAKDVAADLKRQHDYDKRFGDFKEKRHKFLTAATREADHKIETYLGGWKGDMDAMINSVPVPMIPAAQHPWWVALAGNLLWAGTCFINPVAGEAMIMMRVMSVAGSVIGTGVLPSPVGSQSLDPPSNTANGPKQIVLTAVAKAKGQLEEYFKSMNRAWALDFPRLHEWDNDDPQVIADFDAHIWGKMFPWIPFDKDKDTAIETEALRMTNSVFAEYMSQYQAYLKSNRWAGQGEMAKYADRDFHPVLKLSFQGTPLWDAERARHR